MSPRLSARRRVGRGEDRAEMGRRAASIGVGTVTDVEIRRRQCRRIVRIDQRRMRQVGFSTRASVMRRATLDPFAVDVEADHRGAGSREGDATGRRIAEPDYGNLR